MYFSLEVPFIQKFLNGLYLKVAERFSEPILLVSSRDALAYITFSTYPIFVQISDCVLDRL